jgi:uncharacterized protein (DUF2235 family)
VCAAINTYVLIPRKQCYKPACITDTLINLAMATDCQACTSVQFSRNIKKRLIVCCDGTFNGVDKGGDDYSSNVARLSRVISNVGISKTGERIPQVVYYQSGVGTGSLTYVDKVRQGELTVPNSPQP